MLTILGKGRLNWMKEGECKGRASGKHHPSWVSEDQVGPDRQIKDGDSLKKNLRGELKQTHECSGWAKLVSVLRMCQLLLRLVYHLLNTGPFRAQAVGLQHRLCLTSPMSTASSVNWRFKKGDYLKGVLWLRKHMETFESIAWYFVAADRL